MKEITDTHRRAAIRGREALAQSRIRSGVWAGRLYAVVFSVLSILPLINGDRPNWVGAAVLIALTIGIVVASEWLRRGSRIAACTLLAVFLLMKLGSWLLEGTPLWNGLLWTVIIGGAFVNAVWGTFQLAAVRRDAADIPPAPSAHSASTKMNTWHLLAFVTLLSTVAGRAQAQSVQVPPPVRIFVEAFRVTDSLSRQAAVQLRAALTARTVPTMLQIVTTEIADKTRKASRDDVASPLEWGRVRDFARQVAAQYIVDVTVTSDSGMVRIIAYVVHPVRTGEPVPMPIVTGRSLNGAVMKLADHLAARSWAIAK